MRGWGSIFSILGLGVLVGGMLFFGVVMAPLVFTRLPLAVAGPFIRVAFPWYYCFTIAAASVAAIGFLLRREWLSLGVAVTIMAITSWLWLHLLPVLDALKAAQNVAGFTRGHELSVWLNGVELFAATVLLIRLAARVK